MCTFKKICVTNRDLSERPLDEQLERVFITSKPDVVILREKDLSEDEYRKLAYKIKVLCDLHCVRLVVNKYYEVARELGTTVQLSIIDYESNNANLNGLPVWVSIHSLQESVRARGSGASAIIAGHIYETDCKKGFPGRGIDFLTNIVEQVDIPVYAIGGIDQFNIEEVASAGASGACQMSYYMNL